MMADVKTLAMLGFHWVLHQCWEAEFLVYIFTSPYPVRWRSGEGILHTAFSGGKITELNHTPILSFYRQCHVSQSHTVPFWSWPPPEHIAASPEVVFSVCLTELVESCKEFRGNASESKNLMSFVINIQAEIEGGKKMWPRHKITCSCLT